MVRANVEAGRVLHMKFKLLVVRFVEGASVTAETGVAVSRLVGEIDGLGFIGWVDGTTDGKVVGRTDGASDGGTDGFPDGPVDGLTDGAADGLVEGLADGLTDG